MSSSNAGAGKKRRLNEQQQDAQHQPGFYSDSDDEGSVRGARSNVALNPMQRYEQLKATMDMNSVEAQREVEAILNSVNKTKEEKKKKARVSNLLESPEKTNSKKSRGKTSKKFFWGL